MGSIDSLIKNDNFEVIEPPDTINEFGDIEIEQKLQVLFKPEPKFLISVVSTLLKTGDYSIVEGLDNLKWIFHFDYYGYNEADKVLQAFHIIHHESTPSFWVRRKFVIPQMSDDHLSPIVRKEEKNVINGPYSEEFVKEVTEQYQKLLGKDIYPLGRLTRKKYYLFVRNNKSQRIYNIGLDFCEFMGEQMNQLEVEYKGIDKKSIEEFGGLTNLMNEFDQLGNIILSSPYGNQLSKTALTKFEWINQKRGENI